MPTDTAHPDRHKALALLTSVNYLNYIDRYILAAVLVSIKVDLGLSDTQSGLLATAFMVPYMFTSPIFGWMGDRFHRSKILAVGAAIWSVASLLTGQAGQFILMLASRFLLGIGESAFTVISIPFLSDFYPPHKRGRILSIFSTALPVGAALGFVLGGVLAKFFGWRMAFYLVGFPGLILALFIWKMKEPRVIPSNAKFDFFKVAASLFKTKKYLVSVLGYCAYSFAVGGVAFWMPSYLQRAYGVNQMNANLIFGGIAVGSGFLGTLVGGHMGDHVSRKKDHGHILVSSYSMFLAFPFFILCLLSENLTLFSVFLGLAQFFFFISTSPINVTIIDSSPNHLRTSAMALAIFACHILGDAISPTFAGWLSDSTGSLKLGMMACSPMILVCAMLWLWASRMPKNS